MESRAVRQPESGVNTASGSDADPVLRAPEDLMRRIIETSHEGCWVVDREGRTLLCNGRMATMLGCDAAQLQAQSVLDFVFPEDEPKVRARLAVNFNGGSAEEFESRFRTIDNREVLVLGCTNALRSADGAILGAIGMFTDITGRKRSEQQLRESEERYRRIVQTATEAICVVDREGKVLFLNEVAATLTGYEVHEALGRSVLDVVFPEDVELMRKRLALNRDGSRQSFAARIRRKDGVTGWVKISSSPLFEEGRLTGVLIMATDITEWKRTEAELALKAESLERSNADLQQFAYVTGHDLQEPLRTVATYAQLLEQRYGSSLDDAAHEYIGFIVGGVRRMDRLIRDLLTFSRVVSSGQAPMQNVDLIGVVQWAMMNLAAAIQESGAVIEFQDLPEVYGDRAQLAQLFQNLIGNAIKYRSAEKPLIRIQAEPGEGDRWVVSVADNGIGIDPSYHSKIFGVFKRLHGAEYPGTGIGLAICQKIVEKHSGRIWVESEEGKGATFRFTLPTI